MQKSGVVVIHRFINTHIQKDDSTFVLTRKICVLKSFVDTVNKQRIGIYFCLPFYFIKSKKIYNHDTQYFLSIVFFSISLSTAFFYIPRIYSQKVFNDFCRIVYPWREVKNIFIKMVLEDLFALIKQELCGKTSMITLDYYKILYKRKFIFKKLLSFSGLEFGWINTFLSLEYDTKMHLMVNFWKCGATHSLQLFPGSLWSSVAPMYGSHRSVW